MFGHLYLIRALATNKADISGQIAARKIDWYKVFKWFRSWEMFTLWIWKPNAIARYPWVLASFSTQKNRSTDSDNCWSVGKKRMRKLTAFFDPNQDWVDRHGQGKILCTHTKQRDTLNNGKIVLNPLCKSQLYLFLMNIVIFLKQDSTVQ